MSDQKDYLTKEKFDEFTKELDFLKNVRRKEVAENLEYAKSLGDLSENAEYHEARDTQASTEDRISKLEAILKNATIVDEKHHTDTVDIGSVVTVVREKDKKTFTYTIVGSEEADMRAGKISVRSPFGEAITKKIKGETFSFATPMGEVSYNITSIK